MAETMQDNLGGQLTILKSQLEELAISFGEILMPVIREIVSRIQSFIDKLNRLDPATKETIIKIALLAAALGPLLIVVGKTISTVGTLMQFVSKIPTMISGAKTAFTALSGAIGGISAPVVAVVAAIAALVAAFTHLWNTNEDFKNSILAIWEQIKATFERLTSGIVDRLNALGFNFESFGDVVKAVWQGLCDILAPWFEGVFTYIAEIFDVIVDVILGILDVFIGLFTGNWEQMWNGIKGIFVGIWDFIPTKFDNEWTAEGIKRILTNEKYCGELMLQKFYRENHLTKRKRVNIGELKKFYVNESHEPIIEKSVFIAVQKRLQKQKESFTPTKSTTVVYPFTGKIQCQCCGKNYRRKTTATGVVWICATYNTKGKKYCPTAKQIPENTLISVCCDVLGTSEFDADIFEKQVEKILVPTPNELIFIFTDRHEISANWKDRSRSESWTDEMKKATAERSRKWHEQSR